VTGRSGIISFSGGYHGMTHGALSVTGNLSPKEAVDGMMPEVSSCLTRTSTVARWVSVVKRA
jgi:4-aminobutyrate aminotransferase-like enzyme